MMEESRTLDWWKRFFSGLWIEVQKQQWSEETTRKQVDFLVDVLRLQPGMAVLDVPCGTGRHSLELARRGFRVTAVDLTEDLVRVGIEQAQRENLAIDWQIRDMRDLPWTARFDAAFSFWGSFGYFEEEENRAFLKAVARTLKPGGRFFMDVHTTETLLPRLVPRWWSKTGEIYVLQAMEFHPESSRILTTWTFLKGNQIETKESVIRLYSYRELLEMLKEAGFEAWEGFGSMEKEPFRLGSTRLYLVATKAQP